MGHERSDPGGDRDGGQDPGSGGLPRLEADGRLLGDRIAPDGVGPRIFFHEVPDNKTVRNRWHLDLAVSGGREVPLDVRRARVDAEAARLVAAGATLVRILDNVTHYANAMLDPEGNEFDLN